MSDTSRGELSSADREVLEFERARWKYPGRREAVVRERFGWSLTRHVQRIQLLLDDPRAEAYDPDLVRRLRVHRDRLRGARTHGMASARTQ